MSKMCGKCDPIPASEWAYTAFGNKECDKCWEITTVHNVRWED